MRRRPASVVVKLRGRAAAVAPPVNCAACPWALGPPNWCCHLRSQLAADGLTRAWAAPPQRALAQHPSLRSGRVVLSDQGAPDPKERSPALHQSVRACLSIGFLNSSCAMPCRSSSAACRRQSLKSVRIARALILVQSAIDQGPRACTTLVACGSTSVLQSAGRSHAACSKPAGRQPAFSPSYFQSVLDWVAPHISATLVV